MCERELETEQRLQYLDPHSCGRHRCVFLVLQGCSTGGPAAQLSAWWWLSLLHLITNRSPKFHWGPEGHFGRVWLSLPDLVSEVSDPQFIRGSKGPLHRVFSTTSYQQLLWTPTVWLPILTELYNRSRPLNRPLNLWNGMFDRHQAEITVMQFRSHSLPVHQSMSVPWEFYLSHFISQIHPRDLFRLLTIGTCPFLPVHYFGMACLAESKVKIQQYQYFPSKRINLALYQSRKLICH